MLLTLLITGVFSNRLLPVMIIALGLAFLSFTATRDRIIDGRFETLPGPQWTTRRGVQRYEPDEGTSESAMVYVEELIWRRGRWVQTSP